MLRHECCDPTLPHGPTTKATPTAYLSVALGALLVLLYVMAPVGKGSALHIANPSTAVRTVVPSFLAHGPGPQWAASMTPAVHLERTAAALRAAAFEDGGATPNIQPPPLALGAGLGAIACALAALYFHRQGLAMAASGGRKVPRPEEVELDTEAVVRYFGATSLQWGLILCSLYLLDQGTAYLTTQLGAADWMPKALIVTYFLFTSVRSRVFSPLDNSRPTVAKEQAAIDDLRRPSWMPPAITFPIVWSTIAILRTISGYLVWTAAGQTMLTPPIMIYMLSLSIGDTWNTINNVEKRLGTAVLGVSVVWAAALTTNYVYYQALPLAGMVLAPQSVWLTIAAYLVYSIWQINGAEPLYPFKPRE